MVHGSAHGIYAANAWTRIGASLIDARFVGRAFRADCAFGPAIRRCTEILVQTRAHRMPLDNVTIAIRTARRWNARVIGWQRQIRFGTKTM